MYSKPEKEFTSNENITIQKCTIWEYGPVVTKCDTSRLYIVKYCNNNLYQGNSGFLISSLNEPMYVLWKEFCSK